MLELPTMRKIDCPVSFLFLFKFLKNFKAVSPRPSDRENFGPKIASRDDFDLARAGKISKIKIFEIFKNF